MHNEGTTKQIARWVALGALFLLPLTPLIVASSFFFPFITGKAFYLRILIEIAVVAWVVLALLDKAYRPRFSWLGASVVAFVVWMFIADAFAPTAAKAFWSNFERMEGWVLLAHLLGFFFAASAVLRVEKKWRAWFLTSLGVAVWLVGYAFLQLNGSLAIHQGSTRIDASLGNSAYFAIYLLFTTFVAGWLALTERRAWLKWSLLALAAITATLIFYTGTRGTIIGLILGLSLAAFLTALTAGGRARRYAAGIFALILILAGSFYLARDSSFVQNNYALERVASISLEDGATRFTIWQMAFKGVAERPVLGWGQEGFNYVFNKYYDPSLYAQEQWFDRAHNTFIDWLSAGGFPAFLLYLSLFVSAIVLLWRRSELSRPERIALTAALVGYAIHNTFVFDNLYSYIYFFAILALIDSQASRPIERFERAPELNGADSMITVLPVAFVVAFALIWYVNVPGMQVARKLITAISPSSAGVSANIQAFQELSARPAFAAQEIREQLVSFAGSALRSSQVTNEQKQQIATLAMTEMQKQVDRYPQDARGHLQLSYLYRAIGDGASALTHTKLAGALSSKKEEILIQAGTIQWDRGDMKAAQADFNAAYALGPKFKVLAEYAAAGNIAAGDRAAADKILIESYGTTTISSDILAVAYYLTKDWLSLITMWTLRTNGPDTSAQTWFSLAAAYYAAGDTANATKAVTTAMRLFPDSAAVGAEALKKIEGKSAGQ